MRFLIGLLKFFLNFILYILGPAAIAFLLYNIDRFQPEAPGSEKLQFTLAARSVLDLYEDPADCLDNLKIAYNSIFTRDLKHTPPSLGSLLTERYTLALIGNDALIPKDTETKDTKAKGRLDKILAVVNLQRTEEPYADLPYADRELLADIKDKLTSLDPDVAKPLVSNLTAVFLEKNDEAKKYRNETSTANQVALIALIVALLAIIIPVLANLKKWVGGLSPKRDPAAPDTPEA
jgi:hypothetical protein